MEDKKAKKQLIRLLVIVTVLWLLSSLVIYVKELFAEVNNQITEYQSRPTIIRAETDEDRKWDKVWRSQYRDYYGVDYVEGEEQW